MGGLAATFLPALLAAPLFIGVLLWAYFRRGFGRRVTVPSTLILAALKREHTARRKFVPPWRFFVELLLLLSLIGGAAGLYLHQSAPRLALLIDNSSSMRADLQGLPGTTRFSLALEQAAEFLGTAASESEVHVYVTSPQLTALSSHALLPSEAASMISGLTPAHGSDGIESALSVLGGDPRFDSVAAFSDRRLEDPDHFAERITVRSAATEMSAAGNVALNALQKERADDGTVTFTAHLQSFGGAVEGIVVLEEYVTHSQGGEWIKRGERPVKIAPSDRFTASLSAGRNEGVAYRARFLQRGTAHSNAVTTDDIWWYAASPEKNTVHVSSPLPLEQLGLNKIAGYSFVQIDDQRLNQLLDDPQAKILLHRSPLPIMPKASALLILPKTSAEQPIRVERLSGEVQLTRWAGAHPVLSYIDLAGFTTQGAAALSGPAWMQVLLSSSHGSLALIGERAEQRLALFGFELLPYEGRATPGLSILLLNTLKWVNRAAFEEGYLRIMQSTPERLANSPYRRIDEAFAEEAATGTVDAASGFGTPGLYRVELPGGEQQFIAVNFASSLESDTAHLLPIKLDKAPVATPSDSSHESNEGRTGAFWAALAILLLIAEMALLLRTSATGRAAR